jgi:hypothetical protein
MRQELEESKLIENNIVLSNIGPSQGSADKIKNKDDQLVKEILTVLQVNDTLNPKSTRIMSGPERTTTKMLIVELRDKESVKLALLNARKLRENEKFKDVNVNPNKTSVQRAAEKKQREKRNELNANMKHQDSMGRRCDINNGRNSFYVVKNGFLKKISIQLSEADSHYFMQQTDQLSLQLQQEESQQNNTPIY